MTTNPTTPATLDFARIRQECPKAFALLLDWFLADKHFEHTPAIDSPAPYEELFDRYDWMDLDNGLIVGDYNHSYELHPRDMFDFFDAQGVLVFIDSGVFVNVIGEFHYVIQEKGVDVCDGGPFTTRPAAETAGFIRAFYLLEERL